MMLEGIERGKQKSRPEHGRLVCQPAVPLSTFNPIDRLNMKEERHMKRTILRSRGVTTILAVGLLGWGAGHPTPAWSDSSCSQRTLKGTYMISCHGVQGDAQSNFAVAGLEHFRGDGTSSGVSTYTDKDKISRQVPFTATYTVNPDCTGTYTATDENGTIHLDIYVARDGSEFSFAFTDTGVVDSGLEQRLSQN